MPPGHKSLPGGMCLADVVTKLLLLILWEVGTELGGDGATSGLLVTAALHLIHIKVKIYLSIYLH